MSSFKIILCHFCESHGPRVLFCSEVKSIAQLKIATHDNSDGRHTQMDNFCPACKSVDGNGFASIGQSEDLKSGSKESYEVAMTDGGKTVFKSSQFPTSADDFSHVRQACVKSLSNEVCIGREGFIYFGDSKNGYTFCHTFYLKDSKARGLQRFYSLLAWTRDRYFLINYFAFFQNNFKLVVSSLSAMADKVFTAEKNLSNSSQSGCSTVGVSSVSTGNAGHSSLASLQLQRSRRLPTARSLSELLNCQNIFEILHQQFTWILRNAQLHFTEVSVPLWMREVDEDDEVTLSRLQHVQHTQQMTTTVAANDDAAQFPKSDMRRTEIVRSCSSSSWANLPGEDRDNHQNQRNRPCGNVKDNPNGGTLKQEDESKEEESCSQEKQQHHSRVLLLPLRALYELLGGDYFMIVCVHTVIGNQVIVRGVNQQFVSAIVNTLSKLLPLGCSHITTESSVYLEAYQCNLLGVQSDVELPRHVLDCDMFALLDVLGEGQELSEYKFEVTSNFYFERAHLPRILLNLERMLVNKRDFSSYEIIDFYSCMKKQIMSKVKTLYQFVKLSSSELSAASSSNNAPKVDSANQSTVSGSRNNRMGGLKGHSKIETCLRMLGAGGENDQLERMLLKFWLNGLSNKYKKDQIKLLAADHQL